ncbi:MAG: hypothetical protein ACXWEG_08520 [Actinomycetota bacterium]
MTGKYDGVHAFLFLAGDEASPPAEVIAAIREHKSDEGPVFFAAEFDGDFAGFAHFSADTLDELVEFMGEQLFDAGIRTEVVTEGSFFSVDMAHPMGPKRQSPRFCAICQVRTTQRPAVVLDAIAEAFDAREPFIGASRVVGTFPLLVELGSDDRDVLLEAIDRLRRVEGVNAERTKVGTTDTGRRAEQASGA